LQRELSYHLHSCQHYSRSDISPRHWINGYPPPDQDYQELARRQFVGYRLQVTGLVEKPLSLNLEDLRWIGYESQIVKHNCIQGWSGVAEWSGVPLRKFIEHCRPLPEARYLVFHGFDDKAKTQPETGGVGRFYETLDMRLARTPQTMLAWEMNGEPLPVPHGAPLRLRVETQLGFKMVKWIQSIEFVDDFSKIGLGHGGWREDYAMHSRVVSI
jgi:DMSO/TMAO reductase YedYZ molybdopterin-dependent catalytic subunit